MQSSLAKFQLFQLNECLLRLHGRCANFSPEIMKHDKMNAEMIVARQKHDEIVNESLLHVRQTKQRDLSPPPQSPSPPQPLILPLFTSPPSPPSTLLQSAKPQLYSDAVKFYDKVVIPHLMSLSFNNNSTKSGPTKSGPTKAGPTKSGSTKSGPTVHDHDQDIKAKVKTIVEAMKELETKYALAKMQNDAGFKSRCNTLVDETNDNINYLKDKLRYFESADQKSLNHFLTDTHNALQNVTKFPDPLDDNTESIQNFIDRMRRNAISATRNNNNNKNNNNNINNNKNNKNSNKNNNYNNKNNNL